jgi:DNA-binding HxlR family transcriptional regulator
MAGMTRYGQYCPITRALEVLGDRWTLLVVRDLLLGSTRFNELARGLPGLSRALLSKRLDQLEKSGLVEHLESGEYRPTQACQALFPLLLDLADWGARWAFEEPRPDELDPVTLMWWIRAGIDPSAFGADRVVLHVLVPDARHRQRFWFVVQPDDVSLCFTDPGFEVDVTVQASLSTLYQVWIGTVELATARRDGRVSVFGRRDVVARLPDALRFSAVAPTVRRARPAVAAVPAEVS